MELHPKIPAHDYLIRTIDSHTEGEPTRIVYDGFPKLKGRTMMEKKKDLCEHYDFLRQALMLEPRGHRDMFGAVLTEPVHEEAAFGIIFLDSGGCLNMCGHGSIGTASMLVETGLVPAQEPYTDVLLDAPSGLIQARVRVAEGHAMRASICNVPSFLEREDVVVEAGGRRIQLDIAFGGSFFALVDADALGLPLRAENIEEIASLGMEIRKAVNASVSFHHPTLDISTVDLVEFYTREVGEEADLRNCVVFGDGQIDRSPCGTGTSAKMAALYARGRLKLGEIFRYESITGSIFEGCPMREVELPGARGRKGILPRITGRACLTGINTWVIDPQDALRYGFLLGQLTPKGNEDLAAPAPFVNLCGA